MKKLIGTLVCIGAVSLSVAQKLKKGEVPQPVKIAFEKKYPTVKSVNWEKEGDGYEASFDLQKEEVSALFDSTGKVKEVETEIETKNLPAAVKNSLSKDYAGYQIKEAAKIIAENVTTYEAEVKRGKQSFDLVFSEDGRLLNKMDRKKEKD